MPDGLLDLMGRLTGVRLSVWRLPVVVVGVALAAGCGGSGQTTGTQLTVQTETGNANAVLGPSRATLRCDGTAVASGFLRNTAGPACALVRRGVVQRITANQRSHRSCSQVYGGPQSAHITGMLDGGRVDLTVTRTDGCGTADWQTLAALLGDPQRQATSNPVVPPTVTVTTTTGPITYQVKRGDTLTALAKRFGVPIVAIMALNHLAAPDHLVEGQHLLIPPVSPVQLEITPPAAQLGAGFVFKLTGAKPSEIVTFEIDAPDSKSTGPPHAASADGVVIATYQTGGGDTAGIWNVVAKGNQGTTAQASFRVDPVTTGQTATSP